MTMANRGYTLLAGIFRELAFRDRNKDILQYDINATRVMEGSGLEWRNFAGSSPLGCQYIGQVLSSIGRWDGTRHGNEMATDKR